MENIITKENLKGILEKKSVFKVLNSVLFALVTNRKDILLKLRVGGGSYTNNKEVVVGVSPIFMGIAFKELMILLTALLGHEAQHVKSSNFEDYIKFLDNESEYLASKGANKDLARKVAQGIGNSIEDGRIEKILVNSHKGFLEKIKFLNMFFWEKQTPPEQELQYFLYSVVTYATLGIRPKDHKKNWGGTELDKQLKSIKSMIIKGINGRTCKDGLEQCTLIIRKCEDYLLSLMESAEEEAMQNAPSQPDFSNSEESETNESGNNSITVHLRPEMQGSDSSSDDENEGSGKCSDNCDEDEKKSTGGESESTEDDSKKEEGEGSLKPETSKDGDNDESLVEKAKDEISETIEKEATSKEKEVAREDKNIQKEQKQEGLTNEDIDTFKVNYKEGILNEFKEFKPIKSKVDLPIKIKAESRKLKKELNQIFANKEGYNLKNQTSGKISTKDLWKVKAGQNNVFVKKGHPSLTDYVVNVLVDFSGSMGYRKFNDAIVAVSLMEEAFKGMFPFKITGFTTGHNSDSEFVEHIQLKGFRDTDSKKNYSWSFGHDSGGMRGNMDGYSIRVGTKELLNRTERDKILFVLSDGLPAEYRSQAEALDDVKSAVKEAQKAGIKVLSIAFGSPAEMEKNREAYEYMYGKHLIMCEPHLISKNLTNVLKKLVSK